MAINKEQRTKNKENRWEQSTHRAYARADAGREGRIRQGGAVERATQETATDMAKADQGYKNLHDKNTRKGL